MNEEIRTGTPLIILDKCTKCGAYESSGTIINFVTGLCSMCEALEKLNIITEEDYGNV